MNFVAQLGVGGAIIVAVLWSLTKLLPFFGVKERNGNGLSICKFTDPQAAQLHSFVLTEKVREVLLSELITQTELLRDIRDEVRRTGSRN